MYMLIGFGVIALCYGVALAAVSLGFRLIERKHINMRKATALLALAVGLAMAPTIVLADSADDAVLQAQIMRQQYVQHWYSDFWGFTSWIARYLPF